MNIYYKPTAWHTPIFVNSDPDITNAKHPLGPLTARHTHFAPGATRTTFEYCLSALPTWPANAQLQNLTLTRGTSIDLFCPRENLC